MRRERVEPQMKDISGVFVNARLPVTTVSITIRGRVRKNEARFEGDVKGDFRGTRDKYEALRKRRQAGAWRKRYGKVYWRPSQSIFIFKTA